MTHDPRKFGRNLASDDAGIGAAQASCLHADECIPDTFCFGYHDVLNFRTPWLYEYYGTHLRTSFFVVCGIG